MKKLTKKELAQIEYNEYCLTQIMVFMGGHFNPEKRIFNIEGRQREGCPDSGYYYTVDKLKYDTMWDGWLKDVVFKIIAIDESVFNYNNPAMTALRQAKDTFCNMPITTPHADIYEKVVNFCAWYNTNKVPQTEHRGA